MLQTFVVNRVQGARRIAGRIHLPPTHTETRYVHLGGGASIISLYTWAVVDGKQRKVLDYHRFETEDRARDEFLVDAMTRDDTTVWTQLAPVPEVPFGAYIGATWNDRARSPGFGY